MAFPPPFKAIKNYNFNCDLYNYEEILKQLKKKPTELENGILSWDEKEEMWTFSLKVPFFYFTSEQNIDKQLIRLLHALNHFRINIKTTNINFLYLSYFIFRDILQRSDSYFNLSLPNYIKLSAYNLLVVMESFLDLFRVSKMWKDKCCSLVQFNSLLSRVDTLCQMTHAHGNDVVNVMLHYALINLRRRLDAVGRILWHMTNDLTVIIATENVAFTDNYDEFEGIDDLWFKDPFTKCTIVGNEVTLRQGFFDPYPYSDVKVKVYANLRHELPNIIQKSCYSHKLEQIEWLHEKCKKPKFQEGYWVVISNYFDFCSEITEYKIEYSMKRAQSNSLSNQDQDDLCEEDFIFAVLILAMKCLVKLVDGKYKKQIPSILRRCFKVLNILRIPDILQKVPLNSVLLLSNFTHQLMKALAQDKQILKEIPAEIVATIAMITYWVTKEYRKYAFRYVYSVKPITKSLPIIKKFKHPY